jgi:DNA-binding CsgD family transcriptional regulator
MASEAGFLFLGRSLAEVIGLRKSTSGGLKVSTTSVPEISKHEIWAETICARCQKKIRRGDPRCVVMFAELGIGPGHPAYSKSAVEDDRLFYHSCDEFDHEREFGLRRYSTAMSFCWECSGENPELTIQNPWFIWREDRRADDPGSTVGGMQLSELARRFSHQKKAPGSDGIQRPRGSAEDLIVSLAPVIPKPKLTEDDYRYRMARFLLSSKSRKMPDRMRKIAQLWADGKKQGEIAREAGVNQSSVSKVIQSAKALLYSSDAVLD